MKSSARETIMPQSPYQKKSVSPPERVSVAISSVQRSYFLRTIVIIY